MPRIVLLAVVSVGLLTAGPAFAQRGAGQPQRPERQAVRDPQLQREQRAQQRAALGRVSMRGPQEVGGPHRLLCYGSIHEALGISEAQRAAIQVVVNTLAADLHGAREAPLDRAERYHQIQRLRAAAAMAIDALLSDAQAAALRDLAR